MQSIQLKTEEYRITHHQDNLFTLKPISLLSSLQHTIQYHFPSLYCLKTEKIIRTLPSICEEKTLPTLFNTQLDLQFNIKTPSLNESQILISTCKSLKNTHQFNEKILAPKPVSRYCQICKEMFQDYLQHIDHSSHKKKLKTSPITNQDFHQLNTILRNKNISAPQNIKQTNMNNKKSKKRIIFNQFGNLNLRKVQSQHFNLQCQGKNKLQELETLKEERQLPKDECQFSANNVESQGLYGSKKRIIDSGKGQNKVLRMNSAKNIELNWDAEDEFKIEVISFKNIVFDDEDQLDSQKVDLQFQRGLNFD